jgi:hypothetical protein
VSQSKQKLLTQAPLSTPPTGDGVTYTPATNVAWPQWVINEMSNAVYKARWEGYKDTPLFAALDDSQRKPYIDMCRGALAWIESQGWVKLGK